MESINKNQVSELLKELENIIGTQGEGSEITEQIIKLLALPDEHFIMLAPGILQNYQKSLNNPNDKMSLILALNAQGMKAEELTSSFLDFTEEVDKLNLTSLKKGFLKDLIGTIINVINDTEGIAKRILQIPIEICHPDAKIPEYAHLTDSGMDIYAIEDITVKPGQTVLIPTGLKVALPVGFELQVRPKSGRALKTKLRVANTPGTIDQGYRDEIKVIIENIESPIRDLQYHFNGDGKVIIDSIEHGRDFVIGKGEKFCQFVLSEVPKASFYQVKTIMDIGEDRNGGFGSTSIYAKDDERYKVDIPVMRKL